MTLYEIAGQYKQLEDIEMSTDSDVEAFLALLSEINDTFDAKVENYCKLMANLEADEAGYESEIARLTKSLKARRNKITRIKDRLEQVCKEVMQAGEKRSVGTFTVRLQKNPEKVNVFMPGLLPVQYLKSEPDVSLIKKDLKEGIDVMGAELVQDVSLRIS